MSAGDLFDMYHRSSVEALNDSRWCYEHKDVWFFCKYKHEGLEKENSTMAQDVNLPALIVDRLAPEGSNLLIQKANSANLDWTWRVTHHNGTTGQSTTYTGSDLPDVFSKFNRFGFNGTT